MMIYLVIVNLMKRHSSLYIFTFYLFAIFCCIVSGFFFFFVDK